MCILYRSFSSNNVWLAQLVKVFSQSNACSLKCAGVSCSFLGADKLDSLTLACIVSGWLFSIS